MISLRRLGTMWTREKLTPSIRGRDDRIRPAREAKRRKVPHVVARMDEQQKERAPGGQGRRQHDESAARMQFVAVVGDDAHVRRSDGVRRDAEQLCARVCYNI